MAKRVINGIGILSALYLPLAFVGRVGASELPAAAPSSQVAKGRFIVSMTPLGAADKGPGATLGRLSLEKQYTGGLNATGKGEMLTARTPTQGSAAYVAIERVTGVLQGRKGSFVLQHAGTITRDADQRLSIGIVPDSGTDALAGISGHMTITVADGEHSFELDYTLPQ